MERRYIAFDVETPNYANDRISAIGLTVVEQGKILDVGTHDELLKRCPLYAQMWTAHTQAKDADMREGGGKHV